MRNASAFGAGAGGASMTLYAMTHQMRSQRYFRRTAGPLAQLRHGLHRAIHGFATGNEEGYRLSAPVMRRTLSGSLLLLHGTGDDNAYVQFHPDD